MKVLENRMKGFTVLELVIAMVLTGIVAGLAYSSWQVTAKQYGIYRKLSKRTTEKETFFSLFRKDVQQSEMVLKKAEGLRMDHGEGKQVEYAFGEDRVLRHQGARVDTLEIGVRDPRMEFRGTPQNLPGMLVDRIVLHTRLGEHRYRHELTKKYGARTLMKWEDRQ